MIFELIPIANPAYVGTLAVLSGERAATELQDILSAAFPSGDFTLECAGGYMNAVGFNAGEES